MLPVLFVAAALIGLAEKSVGLIENEPYSNAWCDKFCPFGMAVACVDQESPRHRGPSCKSCADHCDGV